MGEAFPEEKCIEKYIFLRAVDKILAPHTPHTPHTSHPPTRVSRVMGKA